MEILLIGSATRLESAVPWAEAGVSRVFVAPHAQAAKELMLAHPVPLVITDEGGLALCQWASQAGMRVYAVMLAESCDLTLAQRAISLGVFRLLPVGTAPGEIAEAVAEARQDMERRRAVAFEHVHDELSYWRHATAEAKKLDVFLTSGANLQEMIHEDILPRSGLVELVRVKLGAWGKSGRWSDHLAQMALMNLAKEIFGAHWHISPAVAMEHDTYALFLWAQEQAPALDAAIDRFFTLGQKRLDCALSLKREGPFPVREAPERWRVMIAGDLPGDGPDAPAHKGAYTPPEVQLWADMLQGKQPQRLMNHLHKYIAGRWNGMPPSQDEMQLLYRQLLQAVDIAMGDKNLWGEVLMDPGKYEKYIHGARSLEAFFAFALMTVHEFVRLQNAGEVSLTERVNLYLEEHLDERIQCADVAAAFLTSPDYLNRQFKRQTGRTLKEYITEYKMKNAQRLLRLTRLPVSVVAAKVGYENFSHFSTAYKKIHGVSPIETRKEKG